MFRRLSRPGAVLAAVALCLALAAVPALAANTRTVFFGSPGTTASNPGMLTTTVVTAGGATAFDVELQNQSPSELTHVVIQGGAAAPDPLANPSYPAPSPICTTDASGTTTCIPSLPSGTTYLAAYVSPSSTVPVSCTVSATSLDCSVANMAPNDVAIVRVVLQPPATAGSNVEFWLASSLKEGTSNSGSNQDTFFAYGSFNVLAPGCAAVSNFFLQNQQVKVSNTSGGSTCSQATNVSSNASFSQGAFGQAGSVTSPLYCLPGVTTCFGEMSQANVNFGSNPRGTYVQWDIIWTGVDLPTSGKASGVTHFLDGYDPTTNPRAYVNISFKPKFQCSATLTFDCWVSTASTKTSFEAVIRTGNNGYVRGY